MSEIVFGLVIVALVGLLAWEKYEGRKERAKLVNALMSKNAEQLRDLEFVDKVKIPDVKPEVVEPMTSTADMSDEEFDKHIEEQLKSNG